MERYTYGARKRWLSMDKTTTWVFECDSFRIGYKRTIHKPDKHKPEQQIEAQELKQIEERRIDTYA